MVVLLKALIVGIDVNCAFKCRFKDLLNFRYTIKMKFVIPKRPAVTLFKHVTWLDFKHRNIHNINTWCICFISKHAQVLYSQVFIFCLNSV